MKKAGGPSWEEDIPGGVSHFWGPLSVPDQAVNVVLGPPLTGGDLKDVGGTEQQLLGVSVCHHLPRRPRERVYAKKGRAGNTVPFLRYHEMIPRKEVPTISHSLYRGDA